jgi:hypothetical protein
MTLDARLRCQLPRDQHRGLSKAAVRLPGCSGPPIVISLTVSGRLSDLTLRDTGVLGRGNRQADRGSAAEGAVGLPALAHFQFFRYEIRRWQGGIIPDQAYAVASPQRIPTDLGRTQRLLDLVPAFPIATWGRDELGAGEMWNSNSLTAWLLGRSGHDTDGITMPPHGRAPGWTAGLIVAARQQALPERPRLPPACVTFRVPRRGPFAFP